MRKSNLLATQPGTVLLLVAIVVVLLIVLENYVLMWLWNWLMPYLLGLPLIDFWMMLGLQVFIWLLFGLFSRHISKAK